MQMFQKVRLISGEYAHIVEIYEDGVAYEADIYSAADSRVRTDTIRHSDIASLIVEVEQPLPLMA